MRKNFPELPVIIVSMNEGIDAMNRAYKRGATDVFQVPISAEMVRARMGVLLERAILRKKLKNS